MPLQGQQNLPSHLQWDRRPAGQEPQDPDPPPEPGISAHAAHGAGRAGKRKGQATEEPKASVVPSPRAEGSMCWVGVILSGGSGSLCCFCSLSSGPGVPAHRLFEPSQPSEIGIFIPVFSTQIKLRHREAKELVQGHTENGRTEFELRVWLLPSPFQGTWGSWGRFWGEGNNSHPGGSPNPCSVFEKPLARRGRHGGV